MNVKNSLGVLAVLAVVGGSEVSARAPAKADKKTAAEAREETITLKPKEERDLRVVGLTRVAVGDPDIADIQAMGDDVLRVTAGKPGQTKLTVWTSDGARRSYLIVTEK
ncbi:pilus assembly protein N-terminal domain-containing protein [Melittangium boletus]|uniref:Pilus formation protein N-terminal domain-containing protein n=1 Tax=Melittangium boletus DSM 14713 TaxID=1294270 RepID=A0A250IFR5_9BACT|nr:pilus assembly protein N-terminal domain-containing protein [Melittangium boletus]ATB30012.1 hypothetical protein MEBOL_003467 [Melittangium boletus DSM 14713]